MEDGAKPYTSTNNAKLYQDYKIIRLRWAPNSPELNSIEHCWREIKLQIGKRPYRPLTMSKMKVALLEEWARLPQELINKWIDNQEKRVLQVIAQKGDNRFHG